MALLDAIVWIASIKSAASFTVSCRTTDADVERAAAAMATALAELRG
ncbi:MAG: hypothetical protein KF729_09065 [Sandaracinaceae bacterium]|nr:hypothetical protein [Sandaracinaceae bacterium]